MYLLIKWWSLRRDPLTGFDFFTGLLWMCVSGWLSRSSNTWSCCQCGSYGKLASPLSPLSWFTFLSSSCSIIFSICFLVNANTWVYNSLGCTCTTHFRLPVFVWMWIIINYTTSSVVAHLSDILISHVTSKLMSTTD